MATVNQQAAAKALAEAATKANALADALAKAPLHSPPDDLANVLVDAEQKARELANSLAHAAAESQPESGTTQQQIESLLQQKLGVTQTEVITHPNIKRALSTFTTSLKTNLSLSDEALLKKIQSAKTPCLCLANYYNNKVGFEVTLLKNSQPDPHYPKIVIMVDPYSFTFIDTLPSGEGYQVKVETIPSYAQPITRDFNQSTVFAIYTKPE
ncbi:hypothetical protein KFU94_46110 [Chloroflexi bacterium TSY]|nr:hypothetical protein [Chloroflexi bacterium TSY]